MKICVITNLYPPFDRGGAEQVVVKTVRGLVMAGHQIFIITSTPHNSTIQQFNNVTIYQLHPPNIFFYTKAHEHSPLTRLVWHALDIFNFGIARQVKKIVEREKPDVVHTHNLMGLSFLIPRALRRLGVRHVHTVHDVQLVEPSAMILAREAKSWRHTGWLNKTYTGILRRLMGSPAVVISSTKFLLDFYNQRGFFGQSTRVVLRNPVEILPPPESPPRTAADHIRFLYLGQIEMHKGVHELLQAFLQLPKTIRAELRIVGSGSLCEEIRTAALADDRIIVPGRVDHTAVSALLAVTDVTIVPSLCYENSPTVLMESLAAGVPVVASDIEGISEMIVPGKNGFVVAPGDVAALTARLIWCAEHISEIEAMKKGAVQSVAGAALGNYIETLGKLYRVDF